LIGYLILKANTEQ